jgi:hypothetical protein
VLDYFVECVLHKILLRRQRCRLPFSINGNEIITFRQLHVEKASKY